MTQIKFTDLSVLGAVNSQLENIMKYTVLIALWFELSTHLIYTMTILHTDYFYTGPFVHHDYFTQWSFTFTENTQKLVTEWVIISGPQLLAQLKVLSFLRFHARPSWNLRKNLNFVFMSIGFFVAVGGFAWFDGWIETNITNLDNFKTIFVFLRFEIRQIEKSSWGIKEMVSQAKSKSQVSEFQKNTELSI